MYNVYLRSVYHIRISGVMTYPVDYLEMLYEYC